MSHFLYRNILHNSQKDLISKYGSYKNVNQVSAIKNLNLNFSELKNKPLVVLGLGFLFLLTNKKGCASIVTRSSFSKNLNCNLRLDRVEAVSFLEKFLILNLRNILDLEEGFSKNNFSKAGTFSFTIKDIYVFSELGDDLFKFHNLKNLNISINFTSPERTENIFLLQSLGFSFKN
jgi:hypothetical protein